MTSLRFHMICLGGFAIVVGLWLLAAYYGPIDFDLMKVVVLAVSGSLGYVVARRNWQRDKALTPQSH